jgi:hypothetical protein
MMDRVVQEMLKGSNSRQIAKTLGLKPMEVDRYVAEWQGYARNNQYIQDRAKDALIATDEHYDMIIRNLWDAVHEADASSDLKIKTATLKMIADIEGKRIEMLQKSGLLENQQIADQVIEMERKHEIIIGILRKVTEKYPEAAEFIRREIAKVTGEVVGTVVD